MRRLVVSRVRQLSLLVLLACSCGRTDLVHYAPDASTVTVDAGLDAGLADAGAPDASVVDAGPRDAGPKPCLDGHFTLSPAVPVVLMVLDRSGSMDESFTDGGVTKWNALRAALRSTLPVVNQTMELGLLLYPESDAANCQPFASLNLAPAANQVAALNSLLAATQPGGATPTAAAIQVAADALRSRRTAGTARTLVLATDGQPNCNSMLNENTCSCTCQQCSGPPLVSCGARGCLDLERTVQTLGSAADSGIPTYVIGLQSRADLTLTDALNRMAVAGGRPQSGTQRYYAATSSMELQQAFTAIRDQVGACTFLTDSVPNLDGGIRLTLAGAEIPFSAMGDGWSWTDQANGELQLRGTACLQAIGRAQLLEVVVTCSR